MAFKKTLRGVVGLISLALLAMSISNCSGPTMPPNERTFTSSLGNSHTHTVTLTKTEFQESQNPISKTTSLNANHTHSLLISLTNMDWVNTGGTISVTTEDADFNGTHHHAFTITKWW